MKITGPFTQELYNRMKTGIAQNYGIEEVLDFERGWDMKNDARLIKCWLDFFETDDTHDSIDRAEIEDVVWYRPGKSMEEIVTGISGHKLKRGMIVIKDKQNPLGGRLYMGHVFPNHFHQAFAKPHLKDRFSPKRKSQNREANKKAHQKTYEDLTQTIEEFLRDPSQIEKIQSTKVKQKLLGITEMEVTLEHLKRIQQLDILQHGNSAYAHLGAKNYLVAADPGGQGLNRIGRRIAQSPDEVPQRVKDAYLRLTSDILSMEDREREIEVAATKIFNLQDLRVNASACLGSYKKDLEFLLGLPEEDPLAQEIGKPNLARIRKTLTDDGDIRLIDAIEIFNLPQVDKLRRKINSFYIEKFSDEIKDGMEIAKELYLTDGFWQEDSLRASVPMGRLKTSVYNASLTREDFQALKNYLVLERLAQDTDSIARTQSLEDMKGLVDKVVIASRKVTHMWKQYETAKITVNDKWDCEEAKGEFKQWGTLRGAQPLARGSDIDLVENFELEYDISVEETMTRMDEPHGKQGLWNNRRHRAKSQNEFGLYSKNLFGDLQDLVDQVVSYVPFEDLKDDIEKAWEISKDPIIGYKSTWLPSRRDKYVRTVQQNDIKEVLEAGAIIEGIKNQGSVYQEGLDLKDELRNGIKVKGYIDEKTIYAETRHMYDDLPTLQITPKIQILDVNKMAQRYEELTRDYIPRSDIPDSTMSNLQHALFSRFAKERLAKVGLEIGPYSYGIARRMNSPNAFIQKSFLNQCLELYNKIK